MTQSKSGSNDLEEIIKKLKEKVEELKKENWDVKKENDRLNEHIQLMEMERDKWMTK
jgi:peptidoglycan hydrolase CwlO-like protein|tara:strand:+ start:871 stop:1041 length:171 start_codon:yes stop_codon:yes gene_type:complete